MFRGTFTALITPFSRDGSVDETALRAIVDGQIAAGIDGLVPVGTTGESPTVSHSENIRIVEIVVEQAAGRVPVIAGTGSNSTSEAIDMTRRAKAVGADASLQVAPYYNRPSQEGLYRHFTAIADAADLPIVVYNIPARTGRNIETATLMRMAEHPRIVAVKEASGSIAQGTDVLAAAAAATGADGRRLAVLSGDDNMAVPLTLMGGDGVISVASNVIPAAVTAMIRAALQNDVVTARNEHFRLLPLFQALFIDTNPIPVKYAMARLGLAAEVYRLPMCELSAADKARLDAVLSRLSIVV